MEQQNPHARSVRVVQCGVFEIDLEGGELRKNGLKVRLQELPFKVLTQLLTPPGQLVTREELQKQLWGAHSPADLDLGLNTAIKKLRAAFGDSADNPRFIETIPKRGYRFLAPVRVLERGGFGFLPTTPEAPLRGAQNKIAEPASTGDRLEADGFSKLPNEKVLPPETALPAGEKDRRTEGSVVHLALLVTALRGRWLKSACYGMAALILVVASAVILAGQIETASQHVSIGYPAAKNGVSIESGVARLEEAVAAFRETLKERTRERDPLEWAMIEADFGNALRILGERESGTGRLEEAVAAFREALKERTRERVPIDWAATQNNLGTALMVLGARESGTGRLEEAVAVFREALKERTRERAPIDWAISLGNQGIALMFLAERTNDRMTAETALLQIGVAFETSRSAEHAPLAAYFAARIPEARRIREALKGT